MKKLIMIISLLVVSFGFSQKSIKIYNYTSFPVKIYKIVTKPTSGIYPWCQNVDANIGLLPNQSYTLINTNNIYRFPFLSNPLPLNPILRWQTYASASASTQSLSFLTWVNTNSNNQIFDYLMYGVGTSQGGGTVSLTNPRFNSPFGWNVEFSRVTGTNFMEDIIVFY